MTRICPDCKWFMRNIERSYGVFECSNPDCNLIIQKYHKKSSSIMEEGEGVSSVTPDPFSKYEEEIKDE